MYYPLDGFRNWKITEDIIIESPPAGIDRLPVNRHYYGMTDSAFVTSNMWATLEQKISLTKIGLTPELLDLMVPFDFVCKVM